MKPKLLIVGAFPPPGGNVIGGIVTVCGYLNNPIFAGRFAVRLIDSTQKSNPPPNIAVRLFYSLIRVVNFIRGISERPDAALLFVSPGLSVIEKGLMGWIARCFDVPVLMFPRGGEIIESYRKGILRKFSIFAAMRSANHILCQGRSWQRFAVTDLKFRLEQTDLIFNWSASRELLAIGARRSRPLNARVPRLLFMGWIEKEKGVFELIEACRGLADKYEFSLLFAGGGRAEAGLRKLVDQYRLHSRVSFLGWVGGSKKERLLESSDVLVLPSYSEGFPNSVVEALASRMAVVVTAVGNVPDVLVHREHAMVIPPKDPAALYNALEDIFTRDSLRLELAERGYALAEESFSTERGLIRLGDVINAVIYAYGAR